MKTMKKYVSFLLAAGMLAGMTACSDETPPSSDMQPSEPPPEVVAEVTDEEQEQEHEEIIEPEAWHDWDEWHNMFEAIENADDYIDFILLEASDEYRNNTALQTLLRELYESEMPIGPYGVSFGENELGAKLSIKPQFDMVMDPEDFFNFRYEDEYYSTLTYYVDTERFALESLSQELLDSYSGLAEFEPFLELAEGYETDKRTVISKEDLRNVYFRCHITFYDTAELVYYLPFGE